MRTTTTYYRRLPEKQKALFTNRRQILLISDSLPAKLYQHSISHSILIYSCL